jgi:putative pyoverdin transport system ATP-binding/permease protein
VHILKIVRFTLFDEWAADQDPEFKRIFYTSLLPELKAAGKAVIVITHDDAYFKYADRLIRLEEGHLQAGAVLQQAMV